MSVVRFEIAPRSLALIIATAAGVWLAWELRTVLLVLVLALILAGTFNPVIEWLERRGIGRSAALLLLFVGLLASIAGFLFITVPPLNEQLLRIMHDAPATRVRLIRLLSPHPLADPLTDAVRSAEIRTLFSSVERYLLASSSHAVVVIGYGVTTLVLAFYLVADGKRARGVAYAIVPRRYHLRLARILQRMEVIVGGYMRGQLITSAALGAFTYVLLLACRVPNALSLALFAALVDVIPFIGGLLVIVPAVASALPLGLPVAGIVLGALAVYMELESRILVPRVYGSVLRLPSAAVVLALIAGGTLMGIVGALLALPIAAGLLMMLEELHVEMPGDDSRNAPSRAHDARAEANYERLSAGTTAPDAGEIAKSLAQEMSESPLSETPKA